MVVNVVGYLYVVLLVGLFVMCLWLLFCCLMFGFAWLLVSVVYCVFVCFCLFLLLDYLWFLCLCVL